MEKAFFLPLWCEIWLVIVLFQPPSPWHVQTNQKQHLGGGAQLLSTVFDNMKRDTQILVRQLRPVLFALKQRGNPIRGHYERTANTVVNGTRKPALLPAKRVSQRRLEGSLFANGHLLPSCKCTCNVMRLKTPPISVSLSLSPFLHSSFSPGGYNGLLEGRRLRDTSFFFHQTKRGRLSPISNSTPIYSELTWVYEPNYTHTYTCTQTLSQVLSF